MTHRSRSGGPQAQHVQRKKRDGKKEPRPLTKAELEAEAALNPPPPDENPLTSTPSTNDILALIRHSLAPTITSPDFKGTVQKIKGLLFDKKWLETFGDEGLLEAYAGRWVPSRVLCFRELLADIEELREVILGEGADEDQGKDSSSGEGSRTRIVSLGGGAGSELLAIAALVRGQNILDRRQGVASSSKPLEFVGVDFGPWNIVLDKFSDALKSLWHLDLPISNHQMDLLNRPTPDTLVPLISTDTSLITLIFTVCELMSQNRASTIRLMHDLTTSLRCGGHLLVADSASDIAEFELGSSGRKWPVYMVLDAMLLGMKYEDGKNKWRKVESEDSRWYRLAEGVADSWPVKLENTRYWYRLYRRV
jgi:25S rRNA (uracil2843-N3)-methyltransferase